MWPRERRETERTDMFRSRLDQIIDLNHLLARLARAIDWGVVEREMGAVYSDGAGQPPQATRLMAGDFRFSIGLTPSCGMTKIERARLTTFSDNQICV